MLIIPIKSDAVIRTTNRFTARISAVITHEMDARKALISAVVKSGDGTVVFVDAMSEVLASAGLDD